MQDIELTVGLRIKKLREKKGISQDKLADQAGLNRVHLYRLENGKQSMTLRTLKLIADTLNVTVSQLVKGI